MKITEMQVENGEEPIRVWRDADGEPGETPVYALHQPGGSDYFYITEAAARELVKAIAILKAQGAGMRQFLRHVAPGQEFVLLRTGERYRLISITQCPPWETAYRVLHLGKQKEAHLHPSCHVEVTA